MASTASPNMSSTDQPLKSSSILQELCSRPKNYGANPSTTVASMEPTASATASEGVATEKALQPQPVLPQPPESPSLKMKIKRSNSTNSKEAAEDKAEQPPKKSAASNSKKRKDPVPTSSSSTSSSRSSSPR